MSRGFSANSLRFLVLCIALVVVMVMVRVMISRTHIMHTNIDVCPKMLHYIDTRVIIISVQLNVRHVHITGW